MFFQTFHNQFKELTNQLLLLGARGTLLRNHSRYLDPNPLFLRPLNREPCYTRCMTYDKVWHGMAHTAAVTVTTPSIIKYYCASIFI